MKTKRESSSASTKTDGTQFRLGLLLDDGISFLFDHASWVLLVGGNGGVHLHPLRSYHKEREGNRYRSNGFESHGDGSKGTDPKGEKQRSIIRSPSLFGDRRSTTVVQPPASRVRLRRSTDSLPRGKAKERLGKTDPSDHERETKGSFSFSSFMR